MEYFNTLQSSVEQLQLDKQPIEIQEQFYDFINNIPFIRSLISPNRPYAKDLPRDEEGKIIVDITKPHILEDVDYFRPTALTYQKYKKLTLLRPNANPNSEYGKWIREEIRRCYDGYVRPSDGEWVTGDMYFFLNYCPILLSKIVQGKQAIRVWDFPEFWEGHYYKFHYLDQARKNGHHAAELARRSAGKSFTAAAMMAKRFILGETKETSREVKCLATAYQKEYLVKDGLLNKFQSYIDFCAEQTQFPHKRLKSSLQDMAWKMGYVDLDTGTQKGTLNEVIGVSSKDDSSKLRGKRGSMIVVEEFGCHIKGTKVLLFDGTIKNVEDVVIGDQLMGDDNTPRIVQELYSGQDQLYKITLSNGDFQIVNSKHPVYFKKYNWNNNQYTDLLLTAPELLKIKGLNKGYYIPKAIIQFPKKEILIDPYFLGLWLGDGDGSRLDIANKDLEVLTWLKNNYDGYIRDLNQSKTCKIFHVSMKDKNKKYFKYYNLFNNKHIPNDYKINCSKIQLQLIAGLIDTNGTYCQKKHFFEITQRFDRKHILDDIKFMCECNGLKCSLGTRISTGKKKGILHYRLRISGDVSIIPTKITRKKGVLNTSYRSKNKWNYYTFKVEKYQVGKYYGFLVNKNHLFVLEDLTITHNTFPNLLSMYNVLRPSVEEGDIVYGQIVCQGTASEESSDFASAQEIMYNPLGYNMQDVPNVYDKAGQSKQKFVYFFPGYLNRKGCYDKNGNSDVTKALLEILINRYKVKYNSTDLNSVSQAIAEIPITPQEAILRTKGNIFPIVDINERINQLDSNPSEYDDVYIGTLVQNNGEIEFKVTNDTPIRDFPTKDNKVPGALEIYKMPEKTSSGKIPYDRYILSLDPVDSDQADSMSLSSIFVLDLWTDKIVAEYTGRTDFAEDTFELLRKLCIFYNGKCLYENNLKGCYSYFSKMNCTHLLADTPEYLKDKDLIKGFGIANQSKGVHATAPINNYANTLIRDWLTKPVMFIERDEKGEEVEVSKRNLYTVRNRALLKELSLYNPEINVDRIRSLGMLMLYREEKMILYNGDIKSGTSEKVDINYLGNDPFFKNNYDDKFYDTY